MPSKSRPDTTGKYLEFPNDLLRRFEAFCRKRKAKFAPEVRAAMERHLAYPPPPPVPAPLPTKGDDL